MNAKTVDRDIIAAQMLLRFTYAQNYRLSFESDAINNYEQYLAWRETQNNDRSNLAIPMTYQICDTIRSRMVKAAFSTRPYIDCIPVPQNNISVNMLQQNAEKAKIAASLLNMQLEKNRIFNWYYDFVTNMLIFPGAAAYVGWKYEEKEYMSPKQASINMFGKEIHFPIFTKEKGKVVTWDDNVIQNIDFFDFWPDPRGMGSDISTWRFCFHREWLTPEQIDNKLKLLKDAGMGTVFDVDYDSVYGGSSIEEGRWQRLQEIGVPTESLDYYNEDLGVQEKRQQKLYEVLNYWTPDEYQILVNRFTCAYAGKTPYQRHRRIPFIFQSFEPMPSEVYGRSLCYWLYNLQEELNTQRNQRIDNNSFSLNCMWEVLDTFTNEHELVSRPGGFIHVDQLGKNIKPIPRDTNFQSSINEENITKQDMENASGAPAVVRGANQTGGSQTATEIVTQNSNASARFDIKIQLYEEPIRQMCYLMDMNNQEFIDDKRLVRMFDPQGVEIWRAISLEDFMGEHDYRLNGASIDPSANKEIRRQQLLQFIPMVQQLRLNYSIDRLGEELIKTFDFSNFEQFKLTQEEQQQKQQSMSQPSEAMALEQSKQQAAMQLQQQKDFTSIITTLINAFSKIGPNITSEQQLAQMPIEQMVQGDDTQQQMGNQQSGKQQSGVDINQLLQSLASSGGGGSIGGNENESIGQSIPSGEIVGNEAENGINGQNGFNG